MSDDDLPEYAHLLAQACFAVNGEWAVMRSYTSEVYDQHGVTMRDMGEYADQCVKMDGQWLFASRSFRNVHRQQAPKGV